MTAKPKTVPAHMTFLEDGRGGAWVGRPFGDPYRILDVKRAEVFGWDSPAASMSMAGFRCRIVEERPEWRETPRYVITKQARSKHARHTAVFDDLTAAQEACIRWFGRNFRVLAPQ